MFNNDTVQETGNEVKPMVCATVLSDTAVLCLVFLGVVMREVE